ncbi:MAG: hypothetical protein JXR96_04970 [Deltaproteobacteria bacterium]|nr:hypothetical protein [Deltaproteobacteria bacterium]
MEPSIILDESARENGLAIMLADLIRQNLEQRPEKVKAFNLLRAAVAITATDAEVSLTLYFNHGSCVVLDGLVGKPDLHIEAESEAILGLSTVPVRCYLPNLLDPSGQKMVKDLLGGALKVHGMAFHPLTLLLLTNVFSVSE